MTTTSPEQTVLADAARILAAHPALQPVVERLAGAPLHRTTVGEPRARLDDSYPLAAAALDRLRVSDAAAPNADAHRRRPASVTLHAPASRGASRRGHR